MAEPLEKSDEEDNVDIDLEICESICDLAEDEIDTDDVVYFFTWNPHDRFYGCITEDKQYKMMWYQMIQRGLRYFRKCSKKYAFNPEFSEIGRLHCHGWFVMKDKIKWIRGVMPKLRKGGFIKVSKQNKKSKGMEYYREDLSETRQIIPIDSFPFTHLNDKTIINMITEKEYIKQPTAVRISRNIEDFFNLL